MTTRSSAHWFGQDQTDVDSVLAFWHDQHNLHRHTRWYALVDGAFDYGTKPRGDLRGAVNCYEDEPVVGLSEVAPLLVPLVPQSAVLADLLVHCSGRPMISLVASTGTAQDLMNAWRSAYWAYLPESQKMLVRFADTRVLAELPRILRADQWQTYCGPIAAWIIVSRTGQPDLLSRPKSIAAARRLELDQQQLDALMSRAQPDAVLDFMQREMPGAISSALQPSAAYAHVAHTCAQAAAHDIESLVDIAVLATVTEGLDNEAPAMEAIQDVLKTRTWTTGNLGQALLDRGAI